MLSLLLIILGVLHSVAGAFLLSWLWGLFVVPLGAPAIGALHAWGLAALVAYATGAVDKATRIAADDMERTESEKELRQRNYIGASVAALIFAYPFVVVVVHAVMAFAGPL